MTCNKRTPLNKRALAREKRRTSTFLSRARTAIENVDKDFAKTAKWVQRYNDRADKAARRSTYIAAVAAYRLAKNLTSDDDLWGEFQRLAFWEGHSRLNRDCCLSYALMFMYGSHQGQVAARAREHARALKDAWIDDLSAISVYELLDRVAFDGLKKRKESSGSSSGENETRRLSLRLDEGQLEDLCERTELNVWLLVQKRTQPNNQPSLTLLKIREPKQE